MRKSKPVKQFTSKVRNGYEPTFSFDGGKNKFPEQLTEKSQFGGSMISWKNATRIENRKFNSTYHHKPISKILPNTYLSSENSEFKNESALLHNITQISTNTSNKQNRNINSPLMQRYEGRVVSPQCEVIDAFSPIKSRAIMYNRGLRALKPLFNHYD